MIPELMAAVAVATACHSHACQERVAARDFEHVDYVLRHRCNHSVPACIDRAAWRWNVDRWLLRRRALCESRMRPDAFNVSSGATGLFQFLVPSTWNRTPYAHRSPWSAKWNSLAAAWMEHMGRGGEWSCYPT